MVGNFKRVKLIPDGAAKFTKAMGLTCVWDETGGFGLRSWRYAAVFNDMVRTGLQDPMGFVCCLHASSRRLSRRFSWRSMERLKMTLPQDQSLCWFQMPSA